MMSDWLLVFFAAFVCTGSGLTLALAAGEVREAPVAALTRTAAAALILFAAGGVLVVLHLGRPEMIFGALGNPSTGIFREFVTFGLTALSLAAYLGALLRGAEAGTTRMLALAAALFAAALTLAVGSAYVMPWRPAWHTWTLILPFAGWMLTAAAFSLSFLSEEDEALNARIPIFSAGAAALLAVFTAVYLAAAGTGGAESAAARVLFGDLAAPFWAAALLGLLPPALLFAMKERARMISLAGLFCVFAGTALFQWIVQLLGSPVWQFFRK